MKMGSLFDGAGTCPRAAKASGVVPVWASEIEPYPICVTRNHFPDMEHLGDISKIKGDEIEPVDFITFGSPCQDLSTAGKRAGLEGERSGLFMEAIRIFKEMREKTHGKYPKMVMWENVPGVFSSNGGDDFRVVLEELCKVADPSTSIPRPEKWKHDGCIVGNEFSVAWRVLDAQFWGVPQRRKRIFLVADFTGRSAGQVLFESEGLSRNFEPSESEGERTPRNVEDSITATSLNTIVLNDQGGERMDVLIEKTNTLRTEAHHHPCIVEAAGFCTEHSAKAHGVGFEMERNPTLRAGVVPATVYENHQHYMRFRDTGEIAPTVSSHYGTGGNNQPLVVNETPIANTNSETVEPTHAYALQGSMIGRTNENGPQGDGINEDVCFILNTTDRHAVFATTTGSCMTTCEVQYPTL